MVVTIEPMITAGPADVRVLDDEWTVVTADGACPSVSGDRSSSLTNAVLLVPSVMSVIFVFDCA